MLHLVGCNLKLYLGCTDVRISDFIKLSGPVNAESERAAGLNRVKTPCLPNRYTFGTLLWYLLYFVGPEWGVSKRIREWKPMYTMSFPQELPIYCSNSTLDWIVILWPAYVLSLAPWRHTKGNFYFLWLVYRYTASLLHLMHTTYCAFIKSNLVFLNIFGPADPLKRNSW